MELRYDRGKDYLNCALGYGCGLLVILSVLVSWILQTTFQSVRQKRRCRNHCRYLFSDRQHRVCSQHGHKLLFGCAKRYGKSLKKYVLDDFLLYRGSDTPGLFAILFGIWSKRDLGCGTS